MNKTVHGDTVPKLLLERVKSTPSSDAFLAPLASEASGWKRWTWSQALDEVRVLSSGLRALGLLDEQRCALLAGTRVEWMFADLAILSAAGATTTIYPSNTPDECVYILRDSQSRFCFAEDEGQLAKLAANRAQLPDLQKVILFTGKGSPDGWAITIDELRERGRAEAARAPDAFERIARTPTKDSLATLIYTSGTTGVPKGVELTHDCWVYEAEAIDKLGILGFDDSQYLWLPLAHSFGKVLESVQLKLGFPTAIDGRVEKMVENLAVIRPTFVCGVPRIFEKVHNKVVQNAKEGGGLKAAIFDWALKVGREVSSRRQAGQSPGALLALQHAVAQRLVFSKVQGRFGGNLRFFVSGASALSKEVGSFFDAVGLPILEGYGLTETSAGATLNPLVRYKLGAVGAPLAGCEVKIAEDGEVLIRGRNVMRGYHNLPEGTAESFTADRFFKTGDIGELDQDGYLRITDRKKDLIKTSGGKYVAPQFLESKFKAICPYVSQVIVHGDNRKFVAMLVAIDVESTSKWAGDQQLSARSYQELMAEARVRDLFQGFVDALNRELPSYSTVKVFTFLPNDLTIENGELTPSMKVKRKFVEKRYMALLDQFYQGE